MVLYSRGGNLGADFRILFAFLGFWRRALDASPLSIARVVAERISRGKGGMPRLASSRAYPWGEFAGVGL